MEFRAHINVSSTAKQETLNSQTKSNTSLNEKYTKLISVSKA